MPKFESYIRGWMKQIQELLLESEQLRLETDDAGPQDELEYWKARGAKLTLLVDQINTTPARMTLVTLRAAQSKILKVNIPLLCRLIGPSKLCLKTHFFLPFFSPSPITSLGLEQH